MTGYTYIPVIIFLQVLLWLKCPIARAKALMWLCHCRYNAIPINQSRHHACSLCLTNQILLPTSLKNMRQLQNITISHSYIINHDVAISYCDINQLYIMIQKFLYCTSLYYVCTQLILDLWLNHKTQLCDYAPHISLSSCQLILTVELYYSNAYGLCGVCVLFVKTCH